MNDGEPHSIIVLTFGPLAEKLGWKRKEHLIRQNTSISDVVESIGLTLNQQKGLLFAVNGSQCKSDVELQPGDELALLPPVSGG